MKNNNTHLLVVGLSFLAVGVALGLVYSSGAFEDEAPREINVQAQEREEETFEFVSVSADDDAFLGAEDAPVTIIEFSDYQCPYCARFAQDTFPQLKEKYIDQGLVKLVFRDFPLGSHVDAPIAAQGAECVGEEGNEAYFEMHDALFERSAEWSYVEDSTSAVIAIASDLGYDIQSCMENEVMAEEVGDDFAEARSYGVTGTPTVFVNGRKVVGAYPFSVFESLIEAELEAL